MRCFGPLFFGVAWHVFPGKTKEGERRACRASAGVSSVLCHKDGNKSSDRRSSVWFLNFTFCCCGSERWYCEGNIKVPQDRLGWELYEVDIGSPPRSVVAIRGSTGSAFTTTTNQKLQTGMILEDFGSLDKLKTRLQTGPYPVELVFSNLGAGGDAISDTGAPLVTAQDALQLARSNDAGQTANKSGMNGFRVDITDKPTCKIQSRRNDVLEIRYVAQFGDSPVVYDSSERRGTGQPYQMVLGSGDMLTGVDLGLYDMCPGERRRITIPPRFGYGSKGNRLFGVPPDQTLTWDVELVRINGVVGEDDERSRDEMEERVPYSSPR